VRRRAKPTAHTAAPWAAMFVSLYCPASCRQRAYRSVQRRPLLHEQFETLSPIFTIEHKLNIYSIHEVSWQWNPADWHSDNTVVFGKCWIEFRPGHWIFWHKVSVVFLRPLKYIPGQYLQFAMIISKSFPIHLQPTIHTLTADSAVQQHNLRGTYCFHLQGTNFSKFRDTGAVDRTTK
jgi:hypothetical protein